MSLVYVIEESGLFIVITLYASVLLSTVLIVIVILDNDVVFLGGLDILNVYSFVVVVSSALIKAYMCVIVLSTILFANDKLLASTLPVLELIFKLV